MIVDIPRQIPWLQSNKGDLDGTIWSSRGIDLTTNPGKLRPSQKLLVTSVSSETDNPQGLPVGFCKEDGTIGGSGTTRWWTVAGDSVFQSSNENGDFSEDDSGSLPSTFDSEDSDIISFNSKIYAAAGGFLYRRSGSAWTTISSSLSSGRKLLRVYADRLYIVDDDGTVVSMDKAETVSLTGSFTLDINSAGNTNLKISCMREASNGLWIGTANSKGGRAKMFFWDGATENSTDFEKKLQSGMAMAITIKDDAPYVLDNRLVLSTYNGSFFREVGRMQNGNIQLYRFNNTSQNNRWIHPNGMLTIDDEILMAINARPEDPTDNAPMRLPAGVYSYHPDYGITHKYSFSPQQDSAAVVDQGQVAIKEVGAMFTLFDDEELNDRDDQGDFFVGFAYSEDNSTTRYAVAVHDKRGFKRSIAKAAVVTLPQIQSEQVQETWQKFVTMIKPMVNATDKLVVKYRTQCFDAVETDITWVDTTSFTSTDAAWSDIMTNTQADAPVDYEVEGLSGDGGGMLSHITGITEASGTYTITLDETITGATTRTARVRVDRWDKLGETTIDDKSFKIFKPDVISTWIQPRIFILGKDIELERILSKSTVTETL